jgi:hypothetical protein
MGVCEGVAVSLVGFLQFIFLRSETSWGLGLIVDKLIVSTTNLPRKALLNMNRK